MADYLLFMFFFSLRCCSFLFFFFRFLFDVVVFAINHVVMISYTTTLVHITILGGCVCTRFRWNSLLICWLMISAKNNTDSDVQREVRWNLFDDKFGWHEHSLAFLSLFLPPSSFLTCVYTIHCCLSMPDSQCVKPQFQSYLLSFFVCVYIVNISSRCSVSWLQKCARAPTHELEHTQAHMKRCRPWQ